MKQNKINEKKMEDGFVKVSNLLISTGVALVVKTVIKSSIPKEIPISKPTAVLFFIGEVALSGALADITTKQYERKIRGYFKRLKDISDSIGKEDLNGEKDNTIE